MITFLQETALLALSLLSRTIPMMVAGVFVAELIMAFNATARISRISKPLTVWTSLHNECGISFMMAFVSPKAANTMLAKYHRDGIITRREMVIAALMNSFPNVMMHWRTLLPVYIPFLGLTGLFYFLILVFVGIIKTVIVMIVGRKILPTPDETKKNTPEEPPRPKWKEGTETALMASVAPLRQILLISVPTIVIVAALINLGVFDTVADVMQGFGSWFPVPAAGFAIIAAQFGSFIAGASVASTLLAAGTLSPQEILITLLVGNILTSATRGIRWYGTSYAAIFGPRTGAIIQGLSTGLRVTIMIGVVAILSFLWS
ncbi:nucleoside recognition protein [Methanogenium marinum]|uniref:Nucleoside recognition protein n=1 Tax=Methanogenium marinum TaxID=348610 RepID=A0A9Q4PVQ5_9EURY|nr:nucleoside recognition domain-containing protein [Methanogenium marinum]MDE4908275.1 nucleoside recognition protein [Methanogenium marinum]